MLEPLSGYLLLAEKIHSKKYEAIADWATDRYGIDILNKEDIAWRTKYPNVAKRTDELEERINYLELEIRRLQKGKGNGQ